MDTLITQASPTLLNRLLALRRRSSKGTYFVPFFRLQRVLTKPVIAKEVQRLCSQEHQHPRITDIIHGHGLRVFTVLFFLKQEELILDFIESLNNQIDIKLPFEQSQLARISSKVSDRFCAELQWEVIPHAFQSGAYHRRILDDVVLPFTKEARFDEGAGGEIFECVIEAGQHNFTIHKDSPTAIIKKRVKMIRKGEPNREGFKKELQCLELLRCIQHKNIIELLTSYEQTGEYFLLFPKLDMDLATFLKQTHRFAEFEHSLTFFKALSGLASAVEKVHELSVENEESVVSRIGYHHDIRQKNVLVTRNTFVLTDFGLSRLKMPDEDSQTQWINTVGDYIAPECMDENFNGLTVGRAIDIWALGCLIADVATYMELGSAGVQEFRKKRQTTRSQQRIKNYRFFEGDALRESVIEWLNAMNTTGDVREEGITALRDIVALSLQVNEKKRPKASEVTRRLLYVSIKMMYRQIVEVLSEEYLEFDVENGGIPFQRLDAWFDVEKIKAWGCILGMDGDGTIQELFLKEPRTAAELSRKIETFHLEVLSSNPTEQADYTPSIASSSGTKLTSIRPRATVVKDIAIQLWETVPVAYQIRMKTAWRQATLAMIDITRLSMIEERAEMLPAPFSEIAKHAALKRLTEKFWKEGQGSSPDQRKLLIRSSDIEREKQLSEIHSLGWFEQYAYSGDDEPKRVRMRVLIEWVLYAPSWEKQSDEEKILKILGLVEILNQPKPESFRVLDCIGVVPPSKNQNHPSFGLVYRYPNFTNQDPEYDVVTLAELLLRKDLALLLEYKFSIALRICSSIYELHCSDWLHKNICTSNILFFMELKTKQLQLPPRSLDPYLVGFHHSRPDGDFYHSDYDAYNSEPYEHRHPDYIPGKTQFEKRFDYYSIGVLLFEIGFWEPIASFRARHRNIKNGAFREVLIDRYALKLGGKMGGTYMKAVVSCLSGELKQGWDSTGGGDINDAFYWSVVAPLSELRIA